MVVVITKQHPLPPTKISSELHGLQKWSLAVRGKQLLHLRHTSYATDLCTKMMYKHYLKCGNKYKVALMWVVDVHIGELTIDMCQFI